MRKLMLSLCFVLLLCGCSNGITRIGTDRVNWDQILPTNSNITFDNGYLFGIEMNPGEVTIGDGPQYDINLDSYVSNLQGKAITDAINLSMSRSDNRGAYIYIASDEIDNSGVTTPIEINHTSAYGAVLYIRGSGVGWNGGTQIISPCGMELGMFCDATDGVFISDLYLVGNLDSPANVGIYSNRPTQRVHLYNLRVAGFDYGINLTGYYDNSMNNIEISNCDNGCLYIEGHHNRLENIVISQDPYCSDSYGAYVNGIGNYIDIDTGKAGEEPGSVGLLIKGNSNTAVVWIEPISTEGDRILIDGSSNFVTITGEDGAAPYGRIKIADWCDGSNIINPQWASYLSCNITFGTGTYYNRVIMYPYMQSSSKGVISGTSGQILDYGGMLLSAAPENGYWYRGAVAWNALVSSGGSPGWICTETGHPGIWKPMAAIS